MIPEGKRPVAGISFVIGLIAVAAIAYVALFSGKRAEPPPAQLCPEMPRALATLTRPLTIEAYVTPANDVMRAFQRSLESLLAQYKSAGGGRVETHVIVASDDATRQRARTSGLTAQPFEVDADADMPGMVTGFSGVVLRYGNATAAFDLGSNAKSSNDFWITNKIRELVAKVDGRPIRIGVLTGDSAIALDERNLAPMISGGASIAAIFAQQMPYYRFSPVDLHGGAQDVDAQLDGLVVTQPARDLTDAELARIDAFVMRGKSIAVFAAAPNVRAGDVAMSVELSTHGIEKLLAGYGVELRPDLVADPEHAFAAHATSGSALAEARLSWALELSPPLVDAQFRPFFGTRQLAVPLASSIALHPEKQPRAAVRAVLRTGASAVRSTAADVKLAPPAPFTPAGERGEAIVGAQVVGPLRSAFGAGESTGPARVVVIASTQFLANPLARASAQLSGAASASPLATLAMSYAQRELTSTIVTFKNTLDWLAPNDPFAACPSALPE